jgi:hypothetical protein
MTPEGPQPSERFLDRPARLISGSRYGRPFTYYEVTLTPEKLAATTQAARSLVRGGFGRFNVHQDRDAGETAYRIAASDLRLLAEVTQAGLAAARAKGTPKDDDYQRALTKSIDLLVAQKVAERQAAHPPPPIARRRPFDPEPEE